MEKMVIKGGCALRGTVDVSGAKNAALPLMAAAILTTDEMTYHRVPALRDIQNDQTASPPIGSPTGRFHVRRSQDQSP